MLVEALLKQGIKVDTENADGLTALHVVSAWGGHDDDSPTIAQLLLDYGANVDAKSREGDTPLHFTTLTDSHHITEILLKNKASIDSTNDEGLTPLHQAVVEKSTDTVALLLRWGGSITTRNNKGHSPLYTALKANRDDFGFSVSHRPIIQLLLQYGAYSEPNCKTRYDLTNDLDLLEMQWDTPFPRDRRYQLFYTTLLLAGVKVPKAVVLPKTLQTIQRHIQVTISTLLAPLKLSQKECAKLTPGILGALPQLPKWINFIWRPKAQDFGKALFEALVTNESDETLSESLRQYYHYKLSENFRQKPQNKELLMALKALSGEMRDAVKSAFAPLPILDLVVERVHIEYHLPPEVAKYLVNREQQHPAAHANFLAEIFTHDWLATSCAPPQYAKTSTLETATSSFKRFQL